MITYFRTFVLAVTLAGAPIHAGSTSADLTLEGEVALSSSLTVVENVVLFQNPGSTAGEKYSVAALQVYSNSTLGWELTIDSQNDGYLLYEPGSVANHERIPYLFEVNSFTGPAPTPITTFTFNGSLPLPGTEYSDLLVIRIGGTNFSPTNGYAPILTIHFRDVVQVRPGLYEDTITVTLANLD